MGKLSRVLLLCVVLLFALSSPIFAEDYVIGPGDVLSIGVYGYEELQVKGLIVRPDGKIAFPLVGEIQAAGVTTVLLTESLTTILGEYVKNPNVTINIDKFHTTRVYVLGEVVRAGMYELDKQSNLLDAVGMAGGYTKDAAKKNIFVIHKNHQDKPEKVNLLRLLERGDMSQNIALAEGDVVYLTKSNKINFARDILPYISAAYQINRMEVD